ncbi:MAG: alpha/beta fold hydrolase [Planctomycetota bacterium]|nr:MAG: alpha/beta fold hydrolase [Planctomycetota bacterium]
MSHINYVSIFAPDGSEFFVAAAGEGRPLILLHGFPLDHRLWTHQIQSLSHDFHVIAPDLRGFGKSTLGDGFSMVQLAHDCEFIRQKLAPQGPIVLGGLSMGGYVALEYWAHYSQHLCGLVLANTKPHADDPTAQAARLRMAEEVLVQGTWPTVQGMLPKLLSTTTQTSRPEVVELTRTMMAAVAPQTIAAAQRAMAQRRDFRSELPEIAVPTLVITGQEDPLAPPDATAEWAGSIPQHTFHAIPTAGHLTPLETPQEFNALLGQFTRQATS